MNVVIFGDTHLDTQTDGRTIAGTPIRVLDTYNSLLQIVEFCRLNPVTHVIGIGDYYLHSRPAQRYKTLFHDFVIGLTSMGIQVILIAGNHDLSKNELSKSAISEFKTLNVPNVYVIERRPEVLEFETFSLTAIPWQFSDIVLPNVQTDICVAHATVWADEPQWEDSPSDFQIPLEYFNQFRFSVLGHIHKVQLLQENPPVIYPGSGERHSFGETSDMGFIHITDTWSHIPYNLRPQYDITEIPAEVDPEGMYRLTVWGDYDYAMLSRYFKDAFSFNVKHIPDKTSSRLSRIDHGLTDMTEREILLYYFEIMGTDTEDIKGAMEEWDSL